MDGRIRGSGVKKPILHLGQFHTIFLKKSFTYCVCVCVGGVKGGGGRARIWDAHMLWHACGHQRRILQELVFFFY